MQMCTGLSIRPRQKVFSTTCEKQIALRKPVLIKSTAGVQTPIFPQLRYKNKILTLKVTALTMKNLSHGTPCAVKAACTVWTGAKDSKESDLSVFLFRYSYSSEFFYRLFKRMRKYNAFITAVSQNVDEILRSDTARLMLANSELLVMLNQAATDREELAKLLNISENQLSYITNVPAGHGLIRCGGAIIPFENSFPKNTKLYQLMTTKPDEKF